MEFAPSPTILLIQKLPPELTNEEITDLLKYFGAISVSVMSSKGQLKGSAFAEFSSRDEASMVMRKLHQAPLFGSRLVVQFSDKNFMPVDPTEAAILPEPPKATSSEDTASGTDQSKVAGSNNPDPSLHYLYPPPTQNTLRNISHALVAVPQFYIQVLHLMNKMNLPPPFSQTSEKSIFECPEPMINPPLPSSSESEMESDHESTEQMDKDLIEKEILAEKRIATQAFIDCKTSEPDRKRKKPDIDVDGPADGEVPSTATDNNDDIPTSSSAIESCNTDIQTTLHDLPLDISSIPLPPPSCEPQLDSIVVSGPTQIETPIESHEIKDIDNSDDKVLSASFEQLRSSLRSKCLSQEKLDDLNVFKNYSKGEPSCKLYLKNLNHKLVQEKDLMDIFSPYFEFYLNDDVNQRTVDSIEIKLMVRGQMKGQAFVTLPSVEAASTALSDLHGYLLYDKPMAIMFAKSK